MKNITQIHKMLITHTENVNSKTSYKTDISELKTYKTRDGRNAGKCFFEDGGDGGGMLYAFLNSKGWDCEYGEHDFQWKATSEDNGLRVSYVEGDLIIAEINSI